MLSSLPIADQWVVQVYGFIDVVSGTKWCGWSVCRNWHRKWRGNFFEWSSKALWKSNELKCDGAAATASVSTNKLL